MHQEQSLNDGFETDISLVTNQYSSI